MFEVTVAHSYDPDPYECFLELKNQIDKGVDGQPQILLMHISYGLDWKTIHQLVRDTYPDAQLIGCTTDGEMSSLYGYQEDSAVLTAYRSDEVSFQPGILTGLSNGRAIDYESVLNESVQALGDRPKLCMTFPDSLTVGGDAIIKHIKSHLDDCVIVGGLAADQWHFKESIQFFGDSILRDSAPYLLFGGNIAFSVGVRSGWKPIGDKAKVTKSEGNRVLEINNISAKNFYLTYLSDVKHTFGEHPLLVSESSSGNECLRAPLVWDFSDGSILFAGDVPVDSEVHITCVRRDDIIMASRDSTDMALEHFEGELKAVHIFSCAARSYILGTRTRDECINTMEKTGADLPISGMYGYGEIGPSSHLSNESMVHNETYVTLCLGVNK